LPSEDLPFEDLPFEDLPFEDLPFEEGDDMIATMTQEKVRV